MTIDAWIQKADYSADDYQDVSCKQILELWNNLNVAELDECLQNLEKKKEDSCPWGIGIGHNTGKSIHIYRDSIEKNTFNVLKETAIPKKILGFIPFKSIKAEELDGIAYDKVADLIKDYFKTV